MSRTPMNGSGRAGPAAVPALRIRAVNDREARADGAFVVYWMIAARRASSNFALQRAIELARELDRPLLVVEALRSGHRWASARFHRFALDGMRDNARWFAERKVAYHGYVERAVGDGRGLLEALAREACAIVTDDAPVFDLPELVSAAGARIRVRLEAVDSNGLLPLAATANAFPTAYAFRRFLQKHLREHLTHFPARDPLSKVALRPLGHAPDSIVARWPAVDEELLAGDAHALARLPIDHAVAPVAVSGGSTAAQRELRNFLEHRLVDYADRRNDLDQSATSRLSAYLHWGHISAHEVMRAIGEREGWKLELLSDRANGKREGWWGLAAHVEAFLDQLVTWRELGFVFARHRPDHDRYASLPDWAKRTLAAHAADPRPHLYTRAEFESAATHDELWNAAQGELRLEGRIHNYLRMLWGKKVLEWSSSPEEAFETLVELNNRWALDGRDPNSYSGIAWCLGRFDRPWAPERPIFGVVRFMSSGNTARKLRVHSYVQSYSPRSAGAVQRRLC